MPASGTPTRLAAKAWTAAKARSADHGRVCECRNAGSLRSRRHGPGPTASKMPHATDLNAKDCEVAAPGSNKFGFGSKPFGLNKCTGRGSKCSFRRSLLPE